MKVAGLRGFANFFGTELVAIHVEYRRTRKRRLDGKGVAQLFPSIADSSMVRSDDATTAIRIVLSGARSVATQAQPTAPGMPSYGRQLSDQQIADVLTYMRNSWGGAAPAVSAESVARTRSGTALRPD